MNSAPMRGFVTSATMSRHVKFRRNLKLALRLGSHERWVDARCSASVVAVRVMIPVGPHDQRALLAAHVAFSTCSERYNGRQKPCRALQCYTACTGAVPTTVGLTCVSDRLGTSTRFQHGYRNVNACGVSAACVMGHINRGVQK
jgi:hypothetical protein